MTADRRRTPRPVALAALLASAALPAVAAPEVAPEDSLGVADTGIFSDLDPEVRIRLADQHDPARPASLSAVIDPDHDVLVLSRDGWPIKVYPLTGPTRLTVGPHTLALRPGDRRELAPLLTPGRTSMRRAGARAPRGRRDRDRDGIPDALDILIGAKKAALNQAAYGAGYMRLAYPMGDVPRDVGVCTDVVVRAVRNAGLDLQRELHRDIRRAPDAYPMVESPNPHIDHRRVRTLLPYFLRRWQRLSTEVDDPEAPLHPGDIVFLDTIASRYGPDHIGVVSDRRGPSGKPLIINNWSDGSVTAEMDILDWVPVTHRFRVR